MGDDSKRTRTSRLTVEVVAGPGEARGLARWLEGAAPKASRGLATVALVSNPKVRSLNRQYRGQDAATDVLSFPAGEPGVLGDIVIARGVAARQAREAGHSVGTELRVLALHGLLHLLGHDHEADDGRMARLEQKLRAAAGLREGLIERAAQAKPARSKASNAADAAKAPNAAQASR